MHEISDAVQSSRPKVPEQPHPRSRGALFLSAALVLLGVAAAVVPLARWLIELDAVAAFVAQYPGQYDLPATAPVGLPAWLGWQHFINLFFLVMIVRSGLQMRRQGRPKTFWASKRHPRRKIGLTQWFHLALDLLWVLNGVVFIALLFATGQWMRIVPTSWEAVPNALSAGLQYLTLNWPTAHGWLGYNSLQQIAYFSIVFVAAPLAITSGLRVSRYWPDRWTKLSAAYSFALAKAIHVWVMLFFVAFTVIHVTLVLTTGARRNLNHIYGASDEVSWYGVIALFISLIVIAGAVGAAQPRLLKRLAGRLGSVIER